MKKPVFAVLACLLAGSFLAVSCGGDSASGGEKPADSAAATSNMAASFSKEMGTIKECLQGEVDGKAPCGITFLTDPVTRMCSDVRTGKANEFAGADYSKFTATCESWKTVLQSPAAEKVTQLTQMITVVDALK